MRTTADDHRAWAVHLPVVELRERSFSARLDVSRPEHGFQALTLNGCKLEGHLFAVRRDSEPPRWSQPLLDAYVRGNDLVANYQATDDWPFSPQIYWTALKLPEFEGVLGAISLLVSVQTHLLDTWPRITASSQLRCDEVLRVSPSGRTVERLSPDASILPSTGAVCVLRRLAGLPSSYVEVMPGSDFRELRLHHDRGGGIRLEWHLFSEFLEKGVIRRGRLHGAFLPRAGDVQLALTVCESLQNLPLPLTA